MFFKWYKKSEMYLVRLYGFVLIKTLLENHS